jgi:hypothetical protein
MPITQPPQGNGTNGGLPSQTPQPQAMATASSAEVANAKKVLKQVRKEIAAFHNLRRRNNEVAAGLRPGMMPPLQARQVMAQLRDAEKEQQAVAQLRQLIGILAGREPTRQEVQMGIPAGIENSLGAWPVIVVAGVAATGASVYSIFSYLRAREENIFQQTANPTERMVRRVTDNIWSITALGAVGALGYMYWKHEHEEKEEEKEEEEEEEEAIPNPRPRPVGKLGQYLEKLTKAKPKANSEEKEEDEEDEEDEDENEDEDEEIEDADDEQESDDSDDTSEEDEASDEEDE